MHRREPQRLAVGIDRRLAVCVSKLGHLVEDGIPAARWRRADGCLDGDVGALPDGLLDGGTNRLGFRLVAATEQAEQIGVDEGRGVDVVPRRGGQVEVGDGGARDKHDLTFGALEDDKLRVEV